MRLCARKVSHQELVVIPAVDHSFIAGSSPETTRKASILALAKTFEFIDAVAGERKRGSAISTASNRRVLAGLIGSGIRRSLTPALHMEEGAAQGLDYRYELLDLDPHQWRRDMLPALLASAQERELAGLNITHSLLADSSCR